jgi:hypothetical protein
MSKRQHKSKGIFSEGDAEPGRALDPEATSEAPTIKREFMVTQWTDDIFLQAVNLISRATGTRLSYSHFFRILIKCIAHAMPELQQELARLGQLKRPSNAPGSQAAREEYERAVASAIVAALQSSPPFDKGTGGSKDGRGPGEAIRVETAKVRGA